jgi:hypothetical protein
MMNHRSTEKPAAGRRETTSNPAHYATIRLLAGDLLAGIDALLHEARPVADSGARNWAIRLGEATAHLSLAELANAGRQLRAALASLEYSNDLLAFQLGQRQPPGVPDSDLSPAA